VGFRESVYIGHTTLSRQEVDEVCDKLGETYRGNQYHLLQRNVSAHPPPRLEARVVRCMVSTPSNSRRACCEQITAFRTRAAPQGAHARASTRKTDLVLGWEVMEGKRGRRWCTEQLVERGRQHTSAASPRGCTPQPNRCLSLNIRSI
jgi:hypothetical protein